ncbi:DUF2975 domain-containing protein [Kordiimonas pumila]|uniref:DUF2975 domain-containing protein n=1 Tax=Kordiimonas pumila TaxID=2161677 RepID=A0ABV7D7K3_9PROT|nr:DUF2975 domain-containing protein [Kordiimonas pumila]
MSTTKQNLKAMRWIIYLLLLVVISSPIIYFGPQSDYTFIAQHEILADYGGLSALTQWQKIAGFAVVALPALILAGALVYLLRLITMIENNAWLSEACESACQKFGQAMIWFVVTQFLHRTVLILIITATYPEGQKELSISISSHDIFALLPAIFAFVFAHIVHVARQQQEELDQII